MILEEQSSIVLRGPIWDEFLESLDLYFDFDDSSASSVLVAWIRETLAHGSLKARVNLLAELVCRFSMFGIV